MLLDILIPDPVWEGWSAGALADAAESSLLVVDPIIYSEVSVGFERIEDLDAALPDELQREVLPWDTAFLAGKAYVEYRRRAGSKQPPLLEFFIRAHAGSVITAVDRFRDR